MALDRTLFDFTNRCKLAFVNSLRAAFKSTLIPEIYRYSDEQRSSQIAIYRDFPKREQKYPALLVVAMAADYSVKVINQEELEEVVDGNNVQLGFNAIGPFTMPIKIRVLAQSTTDRERLTDLTSLCIRFLFRNRFARERIAYTKIKTAGELTFKLADETIIYENGVIIDVYSEVNQFFDTSIFELIDRVDLFVDDQSSIMHARVGSNP